MSETIVLEALAGRHIDAVCSEAVELANKERKTVEFDFNGTLVSVKPDSDVKVVIAKWDSDREAAHQEWINSDEYKERERKNAEEWQRKTSAVLTETAASEGDMREVKNPQPYTPKQLADYIDSLVSRNHDYGTAVYAMSLAAVAAFNYVAHKVGSSGFQASCADLDVLRRTRNTRMSRSLGASGRVTRSGKRARTRSRSSSGDSPCGTGVPGWRVPGDGGAER